MLTPGRKYVNGPVRIAANFQDESRADVDPTTVALKLMSPNGTTTTFTYGTDAELVKANTGDYYVDYSPNMSGRWWFRWETTGTTTASALEGSFVVQNSPFYEGALDAYRT
jgi:hypothetical protein